MAEMQYEIDAADITTFNALSQGPKFVVFTGLYKNKRVAVKVSHGTALDDDEKEKFLREVEILKRVNHSNIVQFIGATVKDGIWMAIVLELVENSYDVQQYLKSEVPKQMDAVVNIALLVSKAMEYLHSQGIIHGNICSKNVLMATHVVKLTGFSEATEGLVDEEGTKQMRKNDVYHFGVLLIDLFQGLKFNCLLDHISSQKDNIRKEFLELTGVCISINPEERPEFTLIRQKLESISSTINHAREIDLVYGDLISEIPIPYFNDEMYKWTHNADSPVDVLPSMKEHSISLDLTLALPGASIQWQDIAETSVKTRGEALPISTGQIDATTLDKYMLELKPDVPNNKTAIIRFALRISEAMQHLHAQGIAHRNLNSSHVFLTKDTGDFLRIGGHEEASEEKPDKIEPEHFKADVYSFSQILWELLTNNHTTFQAYASSKKEKRPILEGVPDEVLELLISCGSEKTEERPDFTKITATLTNLLNEITPQPNFNQIIPTRELKI